MKKLQWHSAESTHILLTYSRALFHYLIKYWGVAEWDGCHETGNLVLTIRHENNYSSYWATASCIDKIINWWETHRSTIVKLAIFQKEWCQLPKQSPKASSFIDTYFFVIQDQRGSIFWITCGRENGIWKWYLIFWFPVKWSSGVKYHVQGSRREPHAAKLKYWLIRPPKLHLLRLRNKNKV